MVVLGQPRIVALDSLWAAKDKRRMMAAKRTSAAVRRTFGRVSLALTSLATTSIALMET